ncbi:DUF5914 domain-containing protein [Nocardiopsis coralliicola]
MTGTVPELDAAGITGSRLRRDYAHSRALHARHGRTYFLATRVLPPGRRPAIHALYGFARWVDDLVDEPDPHRSADQTAALIDRVEAELETALSGGHAEFAQVRALADTAQRYAIPPAHFTAFLGSMRADLSVTGYADYAALDAYMYGSAAVIGLQVLPVLGTVVPRDRAEPPAAALGTAFQLTNFLRDLGEDLDRGRLYLPADVLGRHGVDRALLLRCRTEGAGDPRVRAALAELVGLNRSLYAAAEPGCAMLAPASRPCVETALRLYRGILDEIEQADYDVWSRRHRVGSGRRLGVALAAIGKGLGNRAPFPEDPSASEAAVRPAARPARLPLRRLPATAWERQCPTWREAAPRVIGAALDRALARPSGNWFVLAASSEVRSGRPFGRVIAGAEVVAWRDAQGGLQAAPGACPHLGAPLCRGAVSSGALVCRWHGLSLGPEGFPGWQPYPAFDDGVLAWVRLDEAGGEEPLPRPVLPERPSGTATLAAVESLAGRCEPADIVANRLDPWHGSWFHPYSFVGLRVVETPQGSAPDPDRMVAEVAFKVAGRWGVPVRAAFSCPEPRTVAMHIIEGEGAGSVVETHATPLGVRDGVPSTAVIEATVAASDRTGFALAARAAPAVRPFMRAAARRLWRDDLAYAERRYALRAAGRWPG